MKPLLVFTTFNSKEEAFRLAEKLVEQKLAACVQVIEGVKSIYFWKGKVEREEEVLVIAKTTSDRYKELEAFVFNSHPYDVPEIVAVPVEEVLKEYFTWLKDSLK
ncbi:MAG: divalent-cation tolerance protein CutA [Thermodesulfobacteria bacterium]|nr:divalent-cation tolerance protein CutA [Thermodesulfobacteriota bacterium]